LFDWQGPDDFFLKVKEIFAENPQIVFTKKSGDGITLTRKIIAIGGDGTINEVANGFFCVENRLAIYVTNIENKNNNNNADAVFNSMMVKALNSGHNVLLVLAATSKNHHQNVGGTFRFELVGCLGLHRGALHIRLIINWLHNR
jgi:hypothetical protein